MSYGMMIYGYIALVALVAAIAVLAVIIIKRKKK